MKFSAPDWCFFREGMDPKEYYGRLAEMGYSGVEMVDPVRYDAARNAGLTIVNTSAPPIEAGLNRIANHKDAIPRIKNVISHAAENGIGQVIIFSGNREGQSDDEGIENCEKAILELLPLAEEKSIVLTFEMLNVQDHPDYQADSSHYGFELCRRFKSTWLKTVYDIYHMERMGEDSIKDVTGNIEHIAHIHVAESPGRGIPAAKGNIRYDKIVPAILHAGYEGYWGMEFVPAGGPYNELKQTKKLFQELAGHG